MSQVSSPLAGSISVAGRPVALTTLLTSAGFQIHVTVPGDCSREFRAILASRAHDWCKFENVEHEDATIHQRWQQDGNTLLLEGTGWRPSPHDLLHLSLFLQGQPEAVRATVTEDLETPLPPLRRHSLPESIRVADLPETLLAQTG